MSIIKAISTILIGVTTIVSADYVKPVVANFLHQQKILPSVAPPPVSEPPPPAKPRLKPQPKRAAPVAEPKPAPPVAKPERPAPATEPKPAPPAPAEPRPKAEAPEPVEPPKPRPTPRMAPPPPAPRPQEWAESPKAYAGSPERGDESWPEREPPEPEWQLARDKERREPPPEPVPAAVPPDGWPVFCGYQRPCSQRRPRRPEWRLW